jgi:hypothetical protein
MRIDHEPRRIAVHRDADQVILVQNAAARARPFIHPLAAPDGRGVLTEDAPAHHPWQHGLYVGLNDVNGAGFWTEGLYDTHRAIDGTFHPDPLEAPVADERGARWRVTCEWRAIDGAPLLREEQRWQLQHGAGEDGAGAFLLTLDWTLRAVPDVTFGRYDYGGLFLRMPFRKDRGGEVINTAGQRNAQAEAQRAAWVAVSMPIDGREDWAGVALFDHPSNLQFPTPWRVDNELGIGPAPCIAGAWHLRAGERKTFRYGVLAFGGRPDAGAIDARWQAFKEGSGPFGPF